MQTHSALCQVWPTPNPATPSQPIKIGFVNIMAATKTAERQMLALLNKTGLNFEIDYIALNACPYNNAASEDDVAHLRQTYINQDEAFSRQYDCLLINGAPFGQIEFEQSPLHNDLKKLFAFADSANVSGCVGICYGAAALLHYCYGVEKKISVRKKFGLYHVRPAANSAFSLPEYREPCSRYSHITKDEIARFPQLDILMQDETGEASLIADIAKNRLCFLGHPEYDDNTLHKERLRDLSIGRTDVPEPKNYYRNDAEQLPEAEWQEAAAFILAQFLKRLQKPDTLATSTLDFAANSIILFPA